MEVLTSTGQCVHLTPQEAEAMRAIKAKRCNYYFNFSDENVPLDLWNNIEDLFLSNKMYPAITIIDIRDSNLN